MTFHVDFKLTAGGKATASFTAPREIIVKLTRDGHDAAKFAPEAAGEEQALAPGAYRVTAFYRFSPQEPWVPMDVDANEDTATRGVFRASAYVGSTTAPTGASASLKLEAILTVTKS